jgi:hypothetical protein
MAPAAVELASAPVTQMQLLLAPITATMAAAREALERLVRRLYPVLA